MEQYHQKSDKHLEDALRIAGTSTEPDINAFDSQK